MPISRGQLQKQLVPGLNALFGLTYKQYAEEHKSLYEVESSDRSFEEEVKLSGFGAAPTKNEGAGIVYDSAQEAWITRYNHVTVAMGFSITEEAFEDNLYDSLAPRYTKALARSMAHTKQTRAVVPFNTGFGTMLGGDGVYLFSTAHPLVSGGTNANRPVSGTDLSETALENAAIAISQWTDERGLLIAAKPTKLFIPPALTFTAQRIMFSDKRQGTTDNDSNAMRQMGTIPGGFEVIHRFTDTNAWFLKTDIPNGYKHFVRVAIKTGTDGDFDTGNMRYKSRERYSFGVSDPLQYYGSPGST